MRHESLWLSSLGCGCGYHSVFEPFRHIEVSSSQLSKLFAEAEIRLCPSPLPILLRHLPPICWFRHDTPQAPFGPGILPVRGPVRETRKLLKPSLVEHLSEPRFDGAERVLTGGAFLSAVARRACYNCARRG